MLYRKILFLFMSILTFSAFSSSAAEFKSMWLASDAAVREKIQDEMQQRIDKTPAKEFIDFDENPASSTDNPVLQYYDQSFERLLQDIPATTVKPGTVVIWYLYNMGFVIKTPNACFGVDIHHRHAEKLAPLLDFVASTHNHADHYSIPLMRQMSRTVKPVISNFFPNFAFTHCAATYTADVQPNKTNTVKDITIHCYEADHNPYLKKFVMPMEFVCPTGDKTFVFYTSGDCFSHDFLKHKSPKIDIYAVHPRNGMITIKAAETLNPEITFIVHLQELSHEVNIARWQFSVGRQELEVLKKAGRKAYVPVWGEKFLWDGGKLHVCHE